MEFPEFGNIYHWLVDVNLLLTLKLNPYLKVQDQTDQENGLWFACRECKLVKIQYRK